jgi:hypothetical protein
MLMVLGLIHEFLVPPVATLKIFCEIFPNLNVLIGAYDDPLAI